MELFAHLAKWASQFFSIALGIAGIGFLIGFHEFGHFIFCKIFKIRTPTFSIGMGPRLIKKKIGDTEFTLSAIPLGGYVEIAGTDTTEEAFDEKYSFTHKPYYQKMLVIAGGILFNIIFAYVVLAGLYFFGMPKSSLLYPLYASTTISSIEKDSPAEKAQLQEQDNIIAINAVAVENNPLELINYLKTRGDQTVELTILRNNEEKTLAVKVSKRVLKDEERGYLGVDFVTPQPNFLTAIKQGIHATHLVVAQIFFTFKSIFSKKNLENLGGPVMVISQTIKGAQQGIKMFLLLLAFISINLAVLNIIPLPIMDGGQALFYTIEAIIRKPLPEQIKMYIHYVCWIGIIILAFALSIKDTLILLGFKKPF